MQKVVPVEIGPEDVGEPTKGMSCAFSRNQRGQLCADSAFEALFYTRHFSPEASFQCLLVRLRERIAIRSAPGPGAVFAIIEAPDLAVLVGLYHAL